MHAAYTWASQSKSPDVKLRKGGATSAGMRLRDYEDGHAALLDHGVDGSLDDTFMVRYGKSIVASNSASFVY